MSSLRLALKQSLAETGHLALQDKTKKKHDAALRRERKRKSMSGKRKSTSTSYKITNRTKKKHSQSGSSDLVKRSKKKERQGMHPNECTSPTSDSSFANITDADVDVGCVEEYYMGATASDANSILSRHQSSLSDSDTETHGSSCSSDHARTRLSSSEDESNDTPLHKYQSSLQDDMAGVFESERSSADESHRNPKTNVILTPLTLGPSLPEQQQQIHRKKKNTEKRRRKGKDGKRKKDRLQINLTSSTGSLNWDEDGNEQEYSNDREKEDNSQQNTHPKKLKILKKSTAPFRSPTYQVGEREDNLFLSRDCSKKKSSSKQLTVKEPTSEVLGWVMGMSLGKQRRKIQSGLRVKVRFELKSKKRGKDGKLLRKYRWYGGLVTGVGTEGKQIKIKYDDGTTEITGFPDKEIVVDDGSNGKHEVPADAFLPRQPYLPPNSGDINVDGGVRDESSKQDSQHDGITQTDKIEKESRSMVKTQALPSNERVDKFISGNQISQPEALNLAVIDKNGLPRESSEKTKAVGAIGKVIVGSNHSTVKNESLYMEDTIALDKANKDVNRTALSMSPSWESTESSRSFHRPESSPILSTGNSGTSPLGQDLKNLESSLNVKKCKPLMCPTPALHTSKADSKPDLMENKAFTKTNIVIKKPATVESTIPSLKIRLKSISGKHKKPSSLLPLTSNKKVSKINIKSGQGESTVTQSYINSKEQKITDGQVESAWLGDDEGQGLKRTLSELDEASESENDVTSMKRKLAAFRTISDNAESVQDQVASSCKEIKHSPIEEKKPSNDNLPLSIEDVALEANESSDSQIEFCSNSKSTTKPQLQTSSSPLTSIISSNMTLKKKRSRSRSPVLPSHKCGRIEQSNGDRSKLPLKKKYEVLLKKSRKGGHFLLEETDPSYTVGNERQLQRHNSTHAPKFQEDLSNQTFGSGEKSSGEDDNLKHTTSRSGRKAAQSTKQRLTVKEERMTRDSHKKPKRKGKYKGRGIRRGKTEEDGDDNSDEKSEAENWVKCDRCDKWRCIPNSIDVDNLPEHWYCELNVNDPKRNNCNAPEQTQEEVAKERRSNKTTALSLSPHNESLRNKVLQSQVTANNKKPSINIKSLRYRLESTLPSEINTGNNNDMFRNSDLEKGHSTRDSADIEIPMTQNSIPNTILESFTPQVNINEEPPSEELISANDNDGAGSDNTAASALPTSKNIKSSNKRNRRGKDDEKEKRGTKGRKQKESDRQEWVQCEKCEKWRRLPPRVRAKDLPDVWTCDMNDWDPRSASCAVQEDYKKEEPNNSGTTIFNGAQGASGRSNKLSYRNLIRIPNRNISERARAADSLFSSHATDPDGPPTVMYANSSAFQHKGSVHKSVDEEEKIDSLFEFMRKSKLWRDLNNFRDYLDPVPSQVETIVVEKSSESMKAMVYYAIGSRVLTVQDLLLECKCREWNDLQWIELRAHCTLESIKYSLTELINDGLMEVVCNPSHVDTIQGGIIKYRRTLINNDTVKKNPEKRSSQSRCMKISKPWKQSRNE